MTETLDKVKSSLRTAAYATAGIPLLVGDAIAGREVPTPDFAAEHVQSARKQAGTALTSLRHHTEPRTDDLVAKLPDRAAEAITKGRIAVWDRLGIEPPGEAASAEADGDAEAASAEADADGNASGDADAGDDTSDDAADGADADDASDDDAAKASAGDAV